MQNLRSTLRFLLNLIAGLGCLLALFLFCSWCFAPSRTELRNVAEPSTELLAELRMLKDQSVIPGAETRIQVPVDYSEGAAAGWFPREESPLLKPLVEAGILPPLQDRVPEEPLVLRGINGVAQYGGSLQRLNGVPPPRFHPIHLVRFSPQGYPLVPNLAKSWETSDDGRSFTFTLRKGTRWSDGHPFSSADVLYWWENEQLNPILRPNGPDGDYLHRGKPMRVSAPDPLTLVFSFEDPYPLFLEILATVAGYEMLRSPAHALTPYHPSLGNPEKIRDVMRQHSLVNENAVYAFVKTRIETPSLAPWIIKTQRLTPPEILVRNPYFWAVDTEGRQLPYIDRIVSNQKSPDMLAVAAAQGQVSAQARFIRNDNYTMLMRQRETYGYQLHHWVNGEGSDWAIGFNLNRRVSNGNREEEHKAGLLRDKRFRQALSLAIDRNAIVESVYAGMTEPWGAGPPELSPYHIAGVGQCFSRFDPEEANRLLDACGLTERDADGFRRFPGGPSLLFDINYTAFTQEGPGQFVVDDWNRVGIRARLRNQNRSIFGVERNAGVHDMTVWIGYGAYLPTLDMRYYLPLDSSRSIFAPKYADWYDAGGFFNPESVTAGIAPAPDHPLYQTIALYEELKMALTLEERKEIFADMLRIAEEEVFLLNLFKPLPALAVVRNEMRNVPIKGIYSWVFQSPVNLGLETWCFAQPEMSAVDIHDIQAELKALTPVKPLHGQAMSEQMGAAPPPSGFSLPALLSLLLRAGLLLAALALVVLGILRFPFIGKRLVIMVPTLFIISVISFIVIELPPGDAITSKIMVMQEGGGMVSPQEIEDMKNLFRTEEPAWRRYTWWLGLDWFFSFDEKDEGLLQGNMGRSMISLQPVNDQVGDRLLFTFLISLGTILFTWIVALPIGIYSAVRQYSFFDYVFTVIGFIGMCIPGFLLALLMMFAAERWFGLQISGLFSPEYAAQTSWSAGKILDLLRHIWLPILVQGISGTAGMIRVMRANLLDELRKPYVTTALAKGVRPLKLLFKYPVRIALNPFISGIGSIFPELISGGAIISIVMSLPTIGPMQLEAVMLQDMYLAGSMLMLLSLLSVLGTLFSDILLLLVDPRIRSEGGSK